MCCSLNTGSLLQRSDQVESGDLNISDCVSAPRFSSSKLIISGELISECCGFLSQFIIKMFLHRLIITSAANTHTYTLWQVLLDHSQCTSGPNCCFHSLRESVSQKMLRSRLQRHFTVSINKVEGGKFSSYCFFVGGYVIHRCTRDSSN